MTELGSWSRQINPKATRDPKLVYNVTMDSYVALLRKYGYHDTAIHLLVGSNKVNCSTVDPAQMKSITPICMSTSGLIILAFRRCFIGR
ncbi:hypothetical protein K1719_006822 [Acacia pycnantha]|nr:hypothetical protein K1719_006822 [Acacia pycnantha]